MSLSTRMAVAAVASLLLAAPAFAQTAAAPAAKTDTAAPADKKVHSAASLECSKEADEKGLKGKERKKFRRECKKTAADKK